MAARVYNRLRTPTCRRLLSVFGSILNCETNSYALSQTKCIHTNKSSIDFGFLFDIDGVIVRGKKLLPSAREAFRRLVDKHGRFKVPVLFVTNAGNTLRQDKAKTLSEWLGLEISPEQVVMSHSPLKMFRHIHNRHVLVSGQGPVLEIARALGFTNVTTIETLRQCFPHLDMVDHQRRKPASCAFERYFPRIEAVILFGEPVRWETNLQLIIDVLLSNGKPSTAPGEVATPHLPVLACNMDLLWMSEACMPRFAHGCFIHALESLYQKISGHELKYTALMGKPSELTYHHANYLLTEQAKCMNLNGIINTIYCVGDNPESDIYGANLYDRYLQKRSQLHKTTSIARQHHHLGGQFLRQMSTDVDFESDSDDNGDSVYSGFEEMPAVYAKHCESILVCTGVYSSSRDYVSYGRPHVSNHNHRDFVLDTMLTQPKYVTQNVFEAVKLVFQKENYVDYGS